MLEREVTLTLRLWVHSASGNLDARTTNLGSPQLELCTAQVMRNSASQQWQQDRRHHEVQAEDEGTTGLTELKERSKHN